MSIGMLRISFLTSIQQKHKLMDIRKLLHISTIMVSMDTIQWCGTFSWHSTKLKDDFNGDNVGHHDFEKNCFQFMISSLCYNFYHLFRILVLEGKDQKIRMNTFRNKYQKIAVKVIRHARRIILSFSSAYRYKKKFLKYYQKLQN